MALGEVLVESDSRAEATEALLEATRLYEAKGNLVSVSSSRALLDELRARSHQSPDG